MYFKPYVLLIDHYVIYFKYYYFFCFRAKLNFFHLEKLNRWNEISTLKTGNTEVELLFSIYLFIFAIEAIECMLSLAQETV